MSPPSPLSMHAIFTLARCVCSPWNMHTLKLLIIRSVDRCSFLSRSTNSAESCSQVLLWGRHSKKLWQRKKSAILFIFMWQKKNNEIEFREFKLLAVAFKRKKRIPLEDFFQWLKSQLTLSRQSLPIISILWAAFGALWCFSQLSGQLSSCG